MSRSSTLRKKLGWSQSAMADFLGVEQPSVCRLENAQRETGPQARLLEALAGGIQQGKVSLTATPAEALAALGFSTPGRLAGSSESAGERS